MKKKISMALGLLLGGIILGVGLSLFGLTSTRPELPPHLAKAGPGTNAVVNQGGSQAMEKPALAMVNPAPSPGESAEKAPPDDLQTASPAMEQPPEIPVNNPPRGEAPAGQKDVRLAVVIDDIGHNLVRTREGLSLGIPITFSIIPGLSHATQSATMIQRAGQEYIIHLPMEPFDYPDVAPGPNPLLLNQTRETVRRRMQQYFNELPAAVGASNHMGSAYSFDTVRMSVVQAMVAGRKMFYLDSRTSTSPVPAQIARRKGYPFLRRDVFLDNSLDEAAITRMMQQAIQLARKNGSAIAIGHPHPETYRVIRQVLSEDPPRGVALVPLSQLLPKR